MKRFATILLALVMILSLAVPAFAAGTGSITITPPENLDAAATNTYKIYKVFDADGNGENISYKLVEGKTTAPEGFTVDAAGNVTREGELTAEIIEAIADYVKNDNPVATVTTTGSTPVVAENLPNGYYYITTSTGTVVTIDSTNPNATVNDKNIVPTLDKIISDASSVDADGKKALAQVGTDVEYTVTIEVKTGAKGYEFHDRMDSTLKYNEDVKVYVDGKEVDSSNYNKTTAAGDTITIKFDDEWIKTVIGKSIVIEYTATVTNDALQTAPAKNTAWLEYGDENTNNKTPEKSTEVYNAKFTVTKNDGKGAPLAGAGFVIMNAESKYYKIENNVVSWVESIGDATEYTSDAEGKVDAFTGLANGTYTLVEKTVPAGYNKAADSTFTVEEHDYSETNLIQAKTVINNSGSELPSTGGMGTTMFYLFGGIMVLAAVVLLVTKKRMTNVE